MLSLPRLSELQIESLGVPSYESPLIGRRMKFTSDSDRVIAPTRVSELEEWHKYSSIPSFELAGARKKLFFNPKETKCGIVTCGGLCPGLNHVIRSITLTAMEGYGVNEIYGFRYGFAGLSDSLELEPMILNQSSTRYIQESPGTVLGSSRGPQSASKMVDTLVRYSINVLFTIGGEGTLQGAMEIAAEIKRRSLSIAVVSVPKTIDNDLCWIETSFGFATAVEAAKEVLNAAHAEAHSAYNGVGLVKLMGRHSGFIAAHATLASANVNFCLVPEVAFELYGEGGLLHALKRRLLRRGHALIVVGEGAGQELITEDLNERDPSGNVKLKDIGLYLQDQIKQYFHKENIPLTIKYIDPSYTIRSLAANAVDSEFCVLLGQLAVHAAMAGKTDLVIGTWNQNFTHIPHKVVVKHRKQIDPNGETWQALVGTTHQPNFGIS